MAHNSRVSGYGPIFDVNTAWDDPDAKQLGSVLFFNAPDDDFAKDFVETDPYNLHGLYKSIFIARWGAVTFRRVTMLQQQLQRLLMSIRGLAV